MLEGIASLAAAVAWPAVATGALYGFRHPIRRLLIRVRRVGVANVDIEFRDYLDTQVQSLAAGQRSEHWPIEAQGTVIDNVSRKAARLSVGELRKLLLDLASEYDSTRTTMRSGALRIQRQELVAAKMRSLATQATPLVNELASSASGGGRLAAIATLQVLPNAAYNDWLRERLTADHRFIAYHAAVAIRSAARSALPAEMDDLQDLVEQSLQDTKHLPESTDRRKMLRDAEDTIALGIDKRSPKFQTRRSMEPMKGSTNDRAA